MSSGRVWLKQLSSIDKWRRSSKLNVGKNNGEVKEKLWNRLMKRTKEYFRLMYLDYLDAGRDLIQIGKSSPIKTFLYSSSLITSVVLWNTNPSMKKYDLELLEEKEKFLYVSQFIRSESKFNYVERLSKLRNENRLKITSFGFFSCIWFDFFNTDHEKRKNDNAVIMKWSEWHRYVVDIGFFNRWWIIRNQTDDFDVMDDELSDSCVSIIKIVSFKIPLSLSSSMFPNNNLKKTDFKNEEFLYKVRYNNTLPQLPSDLKFISLLSDPQKYAKRDGLTEIEKKRPFDFHLESSIGLPIELVYNHSYRYKTDLKLDEKDVALLTDDTTNEKKRPNTYSWLTKPDYIGKNCHEPNPSNTKKIIPKSLQTKRKEILKELNRLRDANEQRIAIDKTFEEAEKEEFSHPSKKDVHPVEVKSIFPDFNLWQHNFVHIVFDDEPILSRDGGNTRTKERLSRAMISSVTVDKKPMIIFMVPTNDSINRMIEREKEIVHLNDELFQMKERFSKMEESEEKKNYYELIDEHLKKIDDRTAHIIEENRNEKYVYEFHKQYADVSQETSNDVFLCEKKDAIYYNFMTKRVRLTHLKENEEKVNNIDINVSIRGMKNEEREANRTKAEQILNTIDNTIYNDDDEEEEDDDFDDEDFYRNEKDKLINKLIRMPSPDALSIDENEIISDDEKLESDDDDHDNDKNDMMKLLEEEKEKNGSLSEEEEDDEKKKDEIDLDISEEEELKVKKHKKKHRKKNKKKNKKKKIHHESEGSNRTNSDIDIELNSEEQQRNRKDNRIKNIFGELVDDDFSNLPEDEDLLNDDEDDDDIEVTDDEEEIAELKKQMKSEQVAGDEDE
ncbi:hypothetical protein SNEBB_003761 [Seison nebaliae]|nr:hypothetical protein SNEBB_003761 [Seison nebaliae]